MSIEDIDLQEEGMNEEEGSQEFGDDAVVATEPGKFDRLLGENSKKFKLSGMFKEWFLDYSSYVILYRETTRKACGVRQ